MHVFISSYPLVFAKRPHCYREYHGRNIDITNSKAFKLQNLCRNRRKKRMVIPIYSWTLNTWWALTKCQCQKIQLETHILVSPVNDKEMKIQLIPPEKHLFSFYLRYNFCIHHTTTKINTPKNSKHYRTNRIKLQTPCQKWAISLYRRSWIWHKIISGIIPG